MERPWRELDLLPGDVLLSGSGNMISRAIQFATDCEISHVMLAVGEDSVIEATEYRNLAADRSGGVYLRSLDDALGKDEVDRIIVRRPAGIDHLDVVAAAERFLREQPVYSSSGLVLTALLVGLGDGWRERVAGFAMGADTRDEVETYLAEIVADGPGRMVCAELVYRVLHEAHVPLAHDRLLLQDAVQSVRPLAEPVDYPDAGVGSAAERLAEALAFAERRPEEPGSKSAIDRLGWQRYMRLVSRQVRRAYRERQAEPANGDIADLVCPSDFITMEPFETLAEFARSDTGWVRVGPDR